MRLRDFTGYLIPLKNYLANRYLLSRDVINLLLRAHFVCMRSRYPPKIKVLGIRIFAAHRGRRGEEERAQKGAGQFRDFSSSDIFLGILHVPPARAKGWDDIDRHLNLVRIRVKREKT